MQLQYSHSNVCYTRSMAYSEKDRERLKKLFLESYELNKTVSRAVRAVRGLSRSYFYQLIEEDPQFKQDYNDIRIGIGEDLEASAFQLVEKIVQNEDYSKPVLLITLLNANLPDKYRNNDAQSDDAKTIVSELRKMAAKKSKVVKQAEEILDNDNK